MKPLSRCKACGYVMETDAIHDLCPACGLKASVFEPYEPKMSEDRYKLLNLHMHPIILHFPQAFVVTAMGMFVLGLLFPEPLKSEIIIIARFNLLVLPLTVLMGALTGMKDGQLRFKKLTPPVLQYKIRLSIVFFVLSAIGAVMAVTLPSTPGNLILMAGISLMASVVAVILGRAGSKLMDSFLPGK